MKNKLLSLALTTMSLLSYGQNQLKYAESITAKELKEKLYTYSSDEFEGRETGTNGLTIAINYLKNHYIDLDVSSAKEDGDYFQNVPLKLIEAPSVSISIEDSTFKYYNDFISMSGGESIIIDSKDIILVGYGIKDEKYNDYEGIDVAGKIVVANAGEPLNKNNKYIISGTSKKTKWSNNRQELRSKLNTAKECFSAQFFCSI